MGNIRRAVNSLERDEEGVEVVRTGRLYESEPMYVEDQARFINTVIEVSHPCPSFFPVVSSFFCIRVSS